MTAIYFTTHAANVAPWDPTFVRGTAVFSSATTMVHTNTDGTRTVMSGYEFTYDSTGWPTGGHVTQILHMNAAMTVTYAVINGFEPSINDSLAALATLASLPSGSNPYGQVTGYIFSTNDFVSTSNAAGTMFRGREGNDTLSGWIGRDALFGDNGSDTISGGQGSDTLDGGAGTDTLDYSHDAASGGTGAVTVRLNSTISTDGFGHVDTIANFENAIGSDVNTAAYNDFLIGNEGANFFYARAGGDIVLSYGGYDVIYGGLGTDAIYAGTGGDVLVGSGFYEAFNGEIDYLIGESGTDYIYTGSAGYAYIDGGDDNDSITGGGATDYILSGRGNDTVTLGGGGDLVILYASELVAADYDIYTDFTDGYDYIYASASLAGAATFGNGDGYAYLSIAVAGGAHVTVFAGVTAAQIQDQVFFNL
jgi:Ca2+-binding RTX toxin-like protein